MARPPRLTHSALGIEGSWAEENESKKTLKPVDDPIPDHIKRFVHERIDSVEVLEILLLLFADPGETWAALEVSRKLCTSVTSARARLEQLHGAKLLLAVPGAEPPRFRFNDDPAGAGAVVAELEKLYKERRVSVISLIYSRPSEPLRAFLDAFRLRKEEE